MKLRVYRALANLTQQALAERLGVSELSVIKYEGGTTIPSREGLLRIYQLTGGLVAPNDFFDLENLPKESGQYAPDATFVAAGLMSGTSMDGIDGSLVITDGEGLVKELGNHGIRYDSEMKFLLKSCEQSCFENDGNIENARRAYTDVLRRRLSQNESISETELNRLYRDLCFYVHGKNDKPVSFDDVVQRSTDLHAAVTRQLLKQTGYNARNVDILGYHGQTLFHRPSAGITVQVGDGQNLSDQCGIAVVSQFRSNDVRHGGQGAPFAPLYHKALANQIGLTPIVIANCGGIASVTVIGDRDEDLYAYDCGPGCALIDRFVNFKIGRDMDRDGLYGSEGTVNIAVLESLKKKAIKPRGSAPYLDRKPPKSLDVNDLSLIPEIEALTLQDGCATLEAFTVDCIAESVASLSMSIPKLWVLAGGGWQNKKIRSEFEQRIRQRLGPDVRVQSAEQVGWSGQAVEAQIFAYLAVRSLRKLPLSLPGTTGVPTPLTGGELALPGGDSSKTTKRVRSFL